MAGNYAQLLDIINNPIDHSLPAWDNNNKLIEGLTVKQYLLTIIQSLTAGYQFMGVASTNTSGGTPDQNVFYIAGAGTYNGFGSNPITIDAGYIGIIRWNGVWSSDTIKIADVVSVSQNTSTGGVDLHIGDETYQLPSQDSINELNGEINGIDKSSYLYFVRWKTGSQPFVDNSDGNRVRAIYKVKKGTIHLASVSSIYGRNIALYSSPEGCYAAGTTDLIELLLLDWQKIEYTGAINQDCYLLINYRKDNDSIISDADRTAIYNEMDLTLEFESRLGNEIGVLQEEITPIILRDSVNQCDFAPVRTETSSVTPSINGNRLTIGFNVKENDHIKVLMNNSNFLYTVEVWESWYLAVYAPSHHIGRYQTFSDDWMQSGVFVSGQIIRDGIMSLRFKKTDNSVISDAEIEQLLDDISCEIEGSVLGNITDLKERVTKLENDIYPTKEMRIGSLYNFNDYRVSTKDVVALPYQGIKVRLISPNNIRCVFLSGATNGLGTDGGWVLPDGEYTFPDTAIYYKIFFADNDSPNMNPIAVEDVEMLVASGQIRVVYTDKDSQTVTERNPEATKQAAAAARMLIDNPFSANNGHELATFCHISDLHGDVMRAKNFFDFAKNFGVEAALVTGDSVPYEYSDGAEYIIDNILDSSLRSMLVIGNHDVRNSTGTLADLFNKYINPLITQGNYLESQNTPTTKTYYYADFTDKKIRVIVPNYFMITPNSNTEYARLTQEQITWFINTLLSTPNDYGIIVLLHGQEKWITTPASGYEKFYQEEQVSSSIVISLGDGIISRIIDAFISRTTINTSFTEPNITNTSTETVNVVADFSNIDESIDFVAYVAGHSHRDLVGYVPNTTNKQLMLDIVCGICFYGTTYSALANESDLSRRDYGVNQDAFNIYGIDRVKKSVKIVRIGANMNNNMEIRDYMMIPYKD